MNTIQSYIAARTKKKRWLVCCWIMAAIVVFCTVYALILPGVSESRKTLCGVESHEHSAICYAPAENASLTNLPEEDRAAVESLIEAINGLPAASELESTLAALDLEAANATAAPETDTAEADAPETGITETDTADAPAVAPAAVEEAPGVYGRADYTAEVLGQIAALEETFLSLSPAQQETVENWPRLIETKQQLCYLDYGHRIAALPAEEDSAEEDLKRALDDSHAAAELNDAAYSELVAALLPPPAEEEPEEEPAEEPTPEPEAATLTEESEESDESADAEPSVVMGEQATGNNREKLRDSGWFEEYSDAGIEIQAYSAEEAAIPAAQALSLPEEASAVNEASEHPPSYQQVDNPGGANTNEEDGVSVSKTIEGTDQENVFDITLKVTTTQKLEEIINEPDMAVVIVMDISNTMNDNFGGTTRYAAAMEAAEDFLDSFTGNRKLGISKIGYVAFNTDAHEIFGLQPCTNEDEAKTLKNTMRKKTGEIINKAGYGEAHNRFTNIEGGLKMASDMLEKSKNKHKYIIFLSDGFPTTYVNEGYKGYDPYCTGGNPGTDGVFYDSVFKKYCLYGTSYSDKAAIRAREMATSIKGSGTTIFSIGVDVGGQTIQEYIDSSKGKGHSIVDRTSETYEIGDATSTQAYKDWLKNGIGSGYYYDSTNIDGLKGAYEKIFEEIKKTTAASSEADWVASDPMPSLPLKDKIEFIGFYDKTPKLVLGSPLEGEHEENGENTASFDGEKDAISWNLKKSGYKISSLDNKTCYTYQLTYRVRLTNEDPEFAEGTIYDTNGKTTLSYRIVENKDGTTTISDPKTIDFPIPLVHGYLGELTFRKVDPYGNPVPGAEFTLSHATSCGICRGDGTRVELDDQKDPGEIYHATSDENGTVTFSDIPSGHTYTLTETPPPGYACNGNTYTVIIAYDIVTVTVTQADGEPAAWDGKIINVTSHELPQTGGIGKEPLLLGGLLLLSLAASLLLFRRRPQNKT